MKPIKKLNCELCPKCRVILRPGAESCHKCFQVITRPKKKKS